MIKHWPRPSFYVVMALALALDQLTKAWTASAFQPGETKVLLPGFFNLTYVRNPGIAFGMFPGEGLLIGVLVGALALAGIYYSRGINWAAWEPNLVGGCLCGGAVGNLADRLRLGYVVDFFDVHITAWGFLWPVFNVADSLICVSVGWIVLRQVWGKNKT